MSLTKALAPDGTLFSLNAPPLKRQAPQPWLYGDIGRETAEKMLMVTKSAGTFLVREKVGGYVVSLVGTNEKCEHHQLTLDTSLPAPCPYLINNEPLTPACTSVQSVVALLSRDTCGHTTVPLSGPCKVSPG